MPNSEQTSDRVTRLETLVGESGNEGIRGDIAALREAVSKMEMRIYMAMGGGMVVCFILGLIRK